MCDALCFCSKNDTKDAFSPLNTQQTHRQKKEKQIELKKWLYLIQ